MFKNTLTIILLTIAILIPIVSIAGGTVSGNTLLSNKSINTACNANPGLVETDDLTCAVVELNVTNAKSIRLNFQYTHSSATDINIVPESSRDGSVPWYTETISTIANFPELLTKSTSIKIPVTESGTYSIEFGSFISQYVRFRIYTTNGDANDIINNLIVMVQ